MNVENGISSSMGLWWRNLAIMNCDQNRNDWQCENFLACECQLCKTVRKLLPFCRWHFQIQSLKENCCYMLLILWILPLCPTDDKPSFFKDNDDLEPRRRQSIIWTSDGWVYCLLTHMCVTRSWWVNLLFAEYAFFSTTIKPITQLSIYAKLRWMAKQCTWNKCASWWPGTVIQDIFHGVYWPTKMSCFSNPAIYSTI